MLTYATNCVAGLFDAGSRDPRRLFPPGRCGAGHFVSDFWDGGADRHRRWHSPESPQPVAPVARLCDCGPATTGGRSHLFLLRELSARAGAVPIGCGRLLPFEFPHFRHSFVLDGTGPRAAARLGECYRRSHHR